MNPNAHHAPLRADDRAHSVATFKVLAWLFSIASTVLVPVIAATAVSAMETWVIVALASVSWLTLLLLHLGFYKHIPQLLIYSVLLLGCFAVVATGSVRSGVTVMFLAGVAAAGIFLSRTALIASAVFAVVAVGALTWAEMQGYLVSNMSATGVRVWLIESTGILMVGFMVYFSRIRTRRAVDLQMQELNRRLALEAERDELLDRFTRIFRATPSPMLVQSTATLKIVDVNPALERCFGYSRDEIVGRSEYRLWADIEDRERFHQLMAQDQRVDQFKTRGQRSDGTVFDVVVASEQGEAHDNQLIVTTVTDVSQHNRTMEHLRKSEERFSKAVNFIPLTLFIARLSDGLVLEAHTARNGLEEIDIAAIKGKTSLEVGIWPTKAARDAFVATLLRDGHINALDVQMRDRHGDLFDARIWGEPIDIEGEDCILTCIVNVTAEKRREAQLRELAIAMTGQTSEQLLHDLTRHIGTALGANMVTIGSMREMEVQTLSVWRDGEVVPNFVYTLVDAPCGEALQTPELCVFPSDLPQLFAKNEWFAGGDFQAYLGQSLRDGDAEKMGVLSVMWHHPIEVTADMRALISICASRANAELLRLRNEDKIHDLNLHLEQRVTQRTSELQRLNVELDSFAYSVSHDLKSPLRAIDGYAHILRTELEAEIDPTQVALLDRILAATHRMSELIADLLALARVSQATLDLGPVNFSEMAASVAEQHLARHPDQRVVVRIEPDLACYCDANLTRIVLENLLGNAFKYARNRPTPIIEFGRATEPAEELGLFYVRDNGVGFDMTHAEKLFKPFQRLHKPSEFEGSGIGLATVHRIVERHGGRISARSTVGKGTTIYFTLNHTTE